MTSVRRDWTVPILIGVLGGLEIAVLAVLFFLDTPWSPQARQMSQSFSGVVVLVGSILVVLCAATAMFWAIYNKLKQQNPAPGSDRSA